MGVAVRSDRFFLLPADEPPKGQSADQRSLRLYDDDMVRAEKLARLIGLRSSAVAFRMGLIHLEDTYLAVVQTDDVAAVRMIRRIQEIIRRAYVFSVSRCSEPNENVTRGDQKV